MSESVRAFIAFEIQEPAVKKKLADAQALISQTGADLKLVAPENIHITIRFLGEITPKMVDEVFEAMKRVQFVPFRVSISGLGVFPTLNYPRVVWAAISDGADQLRSVFSQLEPQLQQLRFQPDRNGFSPHLTLARVRTGRNKAELADFVKSNVKFDFGTVSADCLRLKRSVLTPRGPIYSTLKEYCPPKAG